MDYSCEPARSSLLNVQQHRPFNAEPSAAALVEFPVTPEDLVYCRNHGPVRQFDDHDYTISIARGSKGDLVLSLAQLKSLFPLTRVVAFLQCAGIRRKEMAAIKPVNGVPWADGVIANCIWGGVSLLDLLNYIGINLHDFLHIEFQSHATPCQDDSYYGASIPFSKVIENAPVLLAYEMNNEPLSPDHGGPLRVVIPGFLGARWVKWVDRIIPSNNESPNFYQQEDYKILPSNVESSKIAKSIWHLHPSLTSLPLNSVIALVNRSSDNTIYVKGYAVPSHCGNVQAVEVTADQGKTWYPARITYNDGRWSWTLWEAEFQSNNENVVVYSRAIDSEGNVQPKEAIWNMRGLAYNGWGIGYS